MSSAASLQGRRILFIGIGFYDYESSIVERLRAQGAVVEPFVDQPDLLREGPAAAVLRRLRWQPDSVVRRHERAMLMAARRLDPHQVLVIKSEGLTLRFLRALRQTVPQAEFVMYQWDALARIAGIEERLSCFDRILSFDRHDALARPNVQFRPLFFRQDEQPRPWSQRDIDVSFVGWLHSDRLAALRCMERNAGEQGLSSHVYLFTGPATRARLAWQRNAAGVHTRTLPYDRVLELHRRSRCVFDLPHAAQTGLTMRAIECIGMGNKLLTTAVDVLHYDFYRPENIQVVCAQALALDRRFIESPPVPVDPAIRHRYSLDAWVADVLR